MSTLMLALTRHREQSIVIDGPCVISVLHLDTHSVMLGITAAEGVKILRAEILLKAQK